MSQARHRFQSTIRTLSAASLIAVAQLGATPATAAITVDSDPIIFWNDLAVRLAITNAPAQTRLFAMVNIAMHDAVNATLGGIDRSYLSGISAPGGDSRAAAARAAHDVLVQGNSANAAQYDAQLTAFLATIADGTAKTNGVETGRLYAQAILADRTGDGSTAVVPYVSTLLPGDWRPTAAGATPAVPQWGGVRTFALSSVNDVVVAPAPELNSQEYTDGYNEVKEIGALNSATRTTEQRNSALFWDTANGATWIRVGLTIAEDEGLDTLGLARAFSTLSVGLADAAITGFSVKYGERLWRPITAIRLGDDDGNDATMGDPTWNSLFPAPQHPSYISTHSALSAAGANILSEFFGDDEVFSFEIDGTMRTFTSLSEAELDAANSRLWGGIHFRFDNDAGLSLGRQVARQTLARGLFAAVPEPSTWLTMIVGFGLAGGAMRRRRRAPAIA